MSRLRPVSRERHGALSWQRFTSYSFAAPTSLAPLAADEVAKAALALPLAFIERAGCWTLAAILGLAPDCNLYVGPMGDWIGAYTPAIFRSYPFRLAKNTASEPVLCIDEASGLIAERGDGEAFFDEEGQPSASIKQVWSFLQQTACSEELLVEACRTLHAAGILQGWPISVQHEDGTQQITGLNRINEVALKELDDATFIQLRRSGVLPVAYAQLLSMGNLVDLGKLAQARAQADAAERAKAKVKPMIALPDDSTIDWDWSKVGR